MDTYTYIWFVKLQLRLMIIERSYRVSTKNHVKIHCESMCGITWGILAVSSISDLSLRFFSASSKIESSSCAILSRATAKYLPCKIQSAATHTHTHTHAQSHL